MRVLLVAPPRLVWPFMNEQDNFLMPQALPYLAAVLRQAEHEVRVIDCMPSQIGWTALRNEIEQWKPDVVASGENHATYASEVMKLVQMVKDLNPRTYTILGGGHFTNVGYMYLQKYPIDLIVRAEGEITLREVCNALQNGGLDAARQEPGVAWWDGEKTVYTAPRMLIEDLNTLPMPAYDLLPMHDYGKAKYLFSNGGQTIHHSRGCPARCSFCVWWTQDATRKVKVDDKGCRQEILAPKWRTKSVEYAVEEIDLLYNKYGKRTFIWTDPTFNVDPAWNDAFADAIIKKGWPIEFMAFVRADFILRDEKNGVLEKLVKAGLRHVCIGVERAEDSTIHGWSKKFYNTGKTHETFKLLRTKYPQVFRQSTFIVGNRDETRESMRRQLDFARTLEPDYPAFHPMTPFPGTAVYDEAKENGWLEIEDFDYYDLMTPVMSSKYLSREEIEQEIIKLNKSYVGLKWFLKGITSPYEYRRNMYKWWALVMMRIFADSVKSLVNPLNSARYTSLVQPKWYS